MHPQRMCNYACKEDIYNLLQIDCRSRSIQVVGGFSPIIIIMDLWGIFYYNYHKEPARRVLVIVSALILTVPRLLRPRRSQGSGSRYLILGSLQWGSYYLGYYIKAPYFRKPPYVAWLRRKPGSAELGFREFNLGALTIAHIILGIPYYDCSTMGPKTLFQLLMPLYYR